MQTEGVFGKKFRLDDCNGSVADFLVRDENREEAFSQSTANPTVAELLGTRRLTRTTIFSPSQSAAGQPFDTAVAIIIFLTENGAISGNLNDEIEKVAAQANRHGSSQPLEQLLMDCLSLSERLNWDQLTAFTARIENLAVLHQLTDRARQAGDQLPLLFAAVQLSGKPAAVTGYLSTFGDTGLQDLGDSLRYGTGGVSFLAQGQERYYEPVLERHLLDSQPAAAIAQVADDFAFHQPRPALVTKWILFLVAGFFIALGVHFVMPMPEPGLETRGFHLIREFLFSLGFLFVVLLLSEPFLAEASQKGAFSLRGSRSR